MERGEEYNWELSTTMSLGLELSSSAAFELLTEKEWLDLERYLTDRLKIYEIAGNPNAPSALLQTARIYEEKELFADALDFYLPRFCVTLI